LIQVYKVLLKQMMIILKLKKY